MLIDKPNSAANAGSPPPTPDREVTVVAIAGSLRHNSVNRALLHAARELAPDNMRVDVVDISEIPLYNQDLDNDENRPESVQALKAAVTHADGVLLATPEYNFGVSGVLKNVVDWVSRPAMRSPFARKPVGMMGASPGALGTARAQEALKTIMMATLALVFPHPGVIVGNAGQKFDDGRLIDEATRSFIAGYMAQFAAFIRRDAVLADAA